MAPPASRATALHTQRPRNQRTMSRTHRFVGGVVLGHIHLVLVTVVGLWMTPFLLKFLGQQTLGFWLIPPRTFLVSSDARERRSSGKRRQWLSSGSPFGCGCQTRGARPLVP